MWRTEGLGCAVLSRTNWAHFGGVRHCLQRTGNMKCKLDNKKKDMEKVRINSWHKIFTIGYCCACANMVFDHGISTEVEDCFAANFVDIKTMKKIGVDERDIELLTPIVKEIERKRKL